MRGETSGLLEKQWCDNICHCQILERDGLWRERGGIVGGMFVIMVYVCDVMMPTNTENVHCWLRFSVWIAGGNTSGH